jgi:hypothetical protein
VLSPRSSSSSESSLTSPYVHSPLLALRLKLSDVSGDLPVGVYRDVYQEYEVKVVRRRGRTLAYEPCGIRKGEVGVILREVLVRVGHAVEDVLVTTTFTFALPLDIEVELDVALAVCIYRGVRNCVHSTFDKEVFARAATEEPVERTPVFVRDGFCLRLRGLRQQRQLPGTDEMAQITFVNRSGYKTLSCELQDLHRGRRYAASGFG